MPAETHNITIEQGATFRLNITWNDSNGSPINLTGYTARMQVRKKHTSPDPPLLTFTTENGAITLGGAAGTIAVVGLATLTDDVDVKTGVYDLELVNGTEVTRLIEGAVTITPEVTR
jgi:hypothetical protein